jgi:hypothetical protein
MNFAETMAGSNSKNLRFSSLNDFHRQTGSASLFRDRTFLICGRWNSDERFGAAQIPCATWAPEPDQISAGQVTGALQVLLVVLSTSNRWRTMSQTWIVAGHNWSQLVICIVNHNTRSCTCPNKQIASAPDPLLKTIARSPSHASVLCCHR